MKGEVRNPTTVWLLSLCTCGMYGLYFIYLSNTELKNYLGKEDLNPVVEALISWVCFPFGLMRLGANIQAAQIKAGAAAAPTDPSITIGAVRYGLVTKDNNAWLQNPAEEAKVVAEMSGRAPKLIVKTTSMRGNPTSDEYALAGFGDAMKRTREECR